MQAEDLAPHGADRGFGGVGKARDEAGPAAGGQDDRLRRISLILGYDAVDPVPSDVEGLDRRGFPEGSAGLEKCPPQGFHQQAIVHLMVSRAPDRGADLRRKMRLPRARFGSVKPLDGQAQVLLIAIAETEVFNVIAGDADQKDAVGAIGD